MYRDLQLCAKLLFVLNSFRPVFKLWIRKDDRVRQVNEPYTAYGNSAKGRISFFKSFAEAAEADREFYRNLTP
jgi:hypothetical protein